MKTNKTINFAQLLLYTSHLMKFSLSVKYELNTTFYNTRGLVASRAKNLVIQEEILYYPKDMSIKCQDAFSFF